MWWSVIGRGGKGREIERRGQRFCWLGSESALVADSTWKSKACPYLFILLKTVFQIPLISSYGGEYSLLDAPEKFFSDLLEIPDYTLRVQAMLQVKHGSSSGFMCSNSIIHFITNIYLKRRIYKNNTSLTYIFRIQKYTKGDSF